MIPLRPWCRLGLTVAALAALATLLGAQGSLDYRRRGNHWEGVLAKPVAGHAVALHAALVEPLPTAGAWPSEVRLRFYLAEKATAHVVVHGQSPLYFYWLDKVERSWRPGAVNDYTWSTAPVLHHIEGLTLAKLDAVVRLDRPTPGRVERVAPAVLGDPRGATAVAGYRFKLRLNGNAIVRAQIHHGGVVVHERRQNRERNGQPFTVRFPVPSEGHPEGWYRLTLSGHFESTNQKLYKEIHFFHRATL